MATIQELMHELEQEAHLSRRALERIPEDRLAWRPHEKSMTLGELASHVAALPAVVLDLAVRPRFEVTTRSEALRRAGPRGALLRSALFGHWAHHRGQLTVYLRLTGAPVPALYGDSTDEPAAA